jgi:hypothetical protein
MANEENLIPLNKRPKSEQRKIQKMGVEASKKKRRWQAEQRERLRSLMGMRLTPELISKLREQGAEIPDGATMSDGMDAAMMIAAILGDPRAYDVVNQYAGKAKKTDAEQEIIESQASAASGEDDAAADDGFIQALNASAADDWADSDRVGIPDLSEDNGKPEGGENE